MIELILTRSLSSRACNNMCNNALRRSLISISTPIIIRCNFKCYELCAIDFLLIYENGKIAIQWQIEDENIEESERIKISKDYGIFYHNCLTFKCRMCYFCQKIAEPDYN